MREISVVDAVDLRARRRQDLRRGLATLTAMLPPDLHSLVTSVEVANASGSLPPSLRLRTRGD